MGVLSFLFGGDDAESSQPEPVEVAEPSKGKPNRLPRSGPLARYNQPGTDWQGMYDDTEALDLNEYLPKPINLQDTPQAPTAYQPPTFHKVQKYMDDPPSEEEWKKFLDRNKQRVSFRDALNMVHSELLANKSAAIADARRLYGDKIIRTGPFATAEAIGSTSVVGPANWAGDEPRAVRNSRQGMSTVDHELMHSYMLGLKPDDERFRYMLDVRNDGGKAHHSVIKEMDARYHNFRDSTHSPSRETSELLDWIERNAEKRMGEYYRQKGFYGPK